MVLKVERQLPSIPVLGNNNVVVIAAVFTGLCAVPATVLLQRIPRCSDRTYPLVFCSGPHQLCPLSVHLRDLTELLTKHLYVAREFNAGNFMIQKTNRFFSAIPIDQAHEQNNDCSKRDGGTVGLTDNPSVLQRWLVAGPEVTALIKYFEDAHQLMGRRHDVIHHDQTANVQNAFRKDVCSLANVMEELGNPFEEESEDLLVLDSKEIADPSPDHIPIYHVIFTR